jgi:NAD(P)-dependent dehydrogenase (short-subunit alcohol dehydrogenase family)
MQVAGSVTMVTGAASGLGRATAEAFVAAGAQVVIVDLPTSAGQAVASDLGDAAAFAAADVTVAEQMEAALDLAERMGPLRALVHCAGRGERLRLVDKEGNPGSLEAYRSIIELNLVGSFNVLRLAAARMARNEPVDDERGVAVLTASIAAYEGQIGQIPYASSKAGIVGMTLVAARDLASRQIRVASIAPGVFDTPILDKVPADVVASLANGVPHPRRLGKPSEFAQMALTIVSNPMVNGETIRLDGALRMGPVG